MRDEEINVLSEPYAIQERGEVDRRFNSAINADVPGAAQLTREILHDFDETSFGISWWKTLNTEERY